MNASTDLPIEDTKRALIAAAELVAAMFEFELPAILIKSYPGVHEKLAALTIELEALGYLEQYRQGSRAPEH